MKKTFKLLVPFIALIIINKAKAQQAGNDQMVVIEGTANVKYNGEYVHIYNKVLNEIHDSTIIVNGRFSFKKHFKEPIRYMFYSSYELRTKQGYSPFGILVDHPSVVQLSADMDNFSNSKSTGSASQDVYENFKVKTRPLEEAMMNKLYAKYGKAYVDSNRVDTSTQKYKSLMADYIGVEAQNKQDARKILESTIRENPGSFASVVLLYNEARDIPLPKLEELYALLSPQVNNGYYAQRIEGDIAGRKTFVIGSTVSDFTLNNPESIPVKFSSLSGKYVLIDFWGSWCGPCHAALPALKELYAKYHGKGLEILGIATEYGSTDAWTKDIIKNQLPWLQMVDNKSVNVSQKLFAIKQFPTTVLIDPNGKIIGRFDYNQEAQRDKKIASIFDK